MNFLAFRNTMKPAKTAPRSPRPARGVQRISISLPVATFRHLDAMVAEKGFGSRSQAIAEMITASLIEHRADAGDEIMSGTITLFYDQSKGNLLNQLADLQRRHVDEVVSSLHVLLEHGHILEVVLVQGPASKLKKIADAMIACKGVKGGKLTLSSTILPPLHGRRKPARRKPAKP
jgi:CopG family nickel-responsive transcriptional regulator